MRTSRIWVDDQELLDAVEPRPLAYHMKELSTMGCSHTDMNMSRL